MSDALIEIMPGKGPARQSWKGGLARAPRKSSPARISRPTALREIARRAARRQAERKRSQAATIAPPPPPAGAPYRPLAGICRARLGVARTAGRAEPGRLSPCKMILIWAGQITLES